MPTAWLHVTRTKRHLSNDKQGPLSSHSLIDLQSIHHITSAFLLSLFRFSTWGGAFVRFPGFCSFLQGPVELFVWRWVDAVVLRPSVNMAPLPIKFTELLQVLFDFLNIIPINWC